MGNLLVVKVHAANIHDTMGGCHVYQAAKSKYPTIEGTCVDEGYKGTFLKFVQVKYVDKVDVSERIKPKQWEILPKRWRVERTFSWFNNSRRLSKDYEVLTSSEEKVVTGILCKPPKSGRIKMTLEVLLWPEKSARTTASYGS